MRSRLLSPKILLTLGFLCCANAAGAQWTSDVLANTAVSTEAHTEDQPKIAATSDGGFYVSYYADSGYDVFLQRLDATGTPVFSGGVLVADRGFSSTQDYGLAVTENDEALLIFRDDRPGGVQITASKVDTSGTLVWGLAGIQLTSTSAFVATPRIASTPGGGAICAWTQDADTRVQRLDPSGTALWASDTVLSDGSAGVTLSDLHPDGAGGALVSCVLSTTFFAPRHLELRRVSSAGSELWRTSVFDGGSLQLGNFPSFLPDGSGGAVMSWYSNSPSLECRAQHVLASGSEAFPHNGVAVSTNGSLLRVDPSAAYDPDTGEIAVFFIETTSSQSDDAVVGQKFDATGNRLWGAGGATIQPMNGTNRSGVATVRSANRWYVAWVSDVGPVLDRIHGAEVGANGVPLAGPMPLAEEPSTRFRLSGARGCVDYAAFVWRDERAGNPDIYAQNLGPGGLLGPQGGSNVVSRNGSGANPDVFQTSSPAVIGQPWTATVGLGGAPFSAILISPGGPNPGLPTSFGELLCNGPFLSPFVSTGSHTLSLPLNCGLIGRTYCMQAAQVTLMPSAVQLTNALDVTIGVY